MLVQIDVFLRYLLWYNRIHFLVSTLNKMLSQISRFTLILLTSDRVQLWEISSPPNPSSKIRFYSRTTYYGTFSYSLFSTHLVTIPTVLDSHFKMYAIYAYYIQYSTSTCIHKYSYCTTCCNCLQPSLPSVNFFIILIVRCTICVSDTVRAI